MEKRFRFTRRKGVVGIRRRYRAMDARKPILALFGRRSPSQRVVIDSRTRRLGERRSGAVRACAVEARLAGLTSGPTVR